MGPQHMGPEMYQHTPDTSWGWAYCQYSQHQPSLIAIQDLAEQSCWHEWNRHSRYLEWGKLWPQVAVEDYAGTKVTSILPTPDSVCRWILGWKQGSTVGCATESSSLLNWVQRRKKEVQNLSDRMSNLQGAHLQRVLERAFFWCFTQRIIKKKRGEGGEKGGKEGEKEGKRERGEWRESYPKSLPQQTKMGKVVGIWVYFELVLCKEFKVDGNTCLLCINL